MLLVLELLYFMVGTGALTAAQPGWAPWLCVAAEPHLLWAREAEAAVHNPESWLLQVRTEACKRRIRLSRSNARNADLETTSVAKRYFKNQRSTPSQLLRKPPLFLRNKTLYWGLKNPLFHRDKNPALPILVFLLFYIVFRTKWEKVIVRNVQEQNGLSELTELILQHILNIGKRQNLSQDQWKAVKASICMQILQGQNGSGCRDSLFRLKKRAHFSSSYYQVSRVRSVSKGL